MPQKTVTNAEIISLTVQVILGLSLVAFGFIFLLMRFDSLIVGTEWWVTFVYVFGVGLLLGAAFGYYCNRVWNALELGLTVFGTLLILVGVIFTFDPQWSFTQSWTMFRSIDWNDIWPLVPLFAGVGLLLMTLLNKQKE
jgi:hypothetical protein